jgi:hypothetical protein
MEATARQKDFSGIDSVNPLIPTVFHETWWLDTASEGSYGIAEVSDQGKVVGRLPYFLRRKFRFTHCTMPPLTYFLGPAVAPLADNEEDEDAKVLDCLAVTQELIRRLPRASQYTIKCHRSVSEVLAFQREGFDSFVQFTHEITPRPHEETWKQMLPKRRKAISGAQKHLSCVDITDPSEFHRFNLSNMNERSLESSYDPEILFRLVRASLERQRGRVIAARDKDGKLAAAAFFVWDGGSCYFLMGTRRPGTYRGSLSLLVWEGIKHAAQLGLIFDMHGVSNDETMAFFTGFGATIAPRYIVKRKTHVLQLTKAIESIFHPLNCYC